MTENTPPQDESPQDANQWWSTPASTGSGTPLTGTDPTILGGNQAFGTAGHAQQPYTPPTYNPQPYGQSGVQPIPQPPSQPTPQPVVQPQMGYTGQQPQPQFTGGYPQQPAFTPRPPQKSNAALWIIGGVVGLVVIIGVVIGIVAVSSSNDSSSSILGKNKVDGDYNMSSVSNACNLVDMTVLSKWATTPKSSPTHTERAPDSTIGGGSLDCNGSYEGGGGKYSTNSASLSLDVNFQSKYGSPDYTMWKDSDTKTTGSGRSSGDLPGVGSQAYYAVEQDDYSSFTVYNYTCATMDSNLSAKVELRIYADSTLNKDDVATTCKNQLKKVLTGLHK
ncbi:resistance to Congo red protein [Nocardia macrotermitis]|uniref:Uncharacterized protein n=1 Tax=Nocardia macrotermitis TaxID=2585198 RepID=A0A7K0CWD9_9NOCA|nr:resistance to Congo red protein [Nocardia macrotermitis]MQY17805.1 hypothetical protein [Nocardia macrotermitis]